MIFSKRICKYFQRDRYLVIFQKKYLQIFLKKYLVKDIWWFSRNICILQYSSKRSPRNEKATTIAILILIFSSIWSDVQRETFRIPKSTIFGILYHDEREGGNFNSIGKVLTMRPPTHQDIDLTWKHNFIKLVMIEPFNYLHFENENTAWYASEEDGFASRALLNWHLFSLFVFVFVTEEILKFAIQIHKSLI